MKKPKPIECDVHLKYLCPKCGYDHWLSLKEASTKNYKIVCDCGKVFGVKRTKNIKLIYENSHKQKYEKRVDSPSIDQSLLNKASSALIAYGFTKEEAINSITEAFQKHPTTDYLELVKQTLASMRV